MRLGVTSADEGMKVIELLNDYPLKHVIIHPRNADQRYSGTVDLDAFEDMYAASRHNIVYNGDIFSVEGFNSLQLRFPSINEWMIGRGALRDPFLAATIKGHVFSDAEKRSKLKQYHDTVLTYYRTAAKNEKI